MRTFLIALGLTALATSAIAADLPRKAPAVPPMQAVQAVDWTGFYIGVHSGYSWGRWDGDLTFDPGTGPVQVFDPSSRQIDANGWLAGGQIGFNYQLGSFVFGSEADISWTNLKGENIQHDRGEQLQLDYQQPSGLVRNGSRPCRCRRRFSDLRHGRCRLWPDQGQ